MTSLDRRAFLKGILYGLLGWALKWEVEAIAATEAAPAAEEELVNLCFLGTGEWCAYCKDENKQIGYDNCYYCPSWCSGRGEACPTCRRAFDEYSNSWEARQNSIPLSEITPSGPPFTGGYVRVGAAWPYRLNDDPLEQLYHDFAVAQARTIDREIMSLQGDKE